MQSSRHVIPFINQLVVRSIYNVLVYWYTLYTPRIDIGAARWKIGLPSLGTLAGLQLAAYGTLVGV